LGGFEHAAAWAVDIARLVIEATTQERPGWLLRDRVDPAVVLATRRQIQRYARDMSVNIAVLLVLLLVFLVSIATGVSR
ncbi:MAG TPA: hypothetical protein VFH17_08160, partial [Coriobacteriia bacterium]|nr:hypothetical protein [Coriobacteriia bacterium]